MGIVLAVIILRFLPLIIGLGVIAILVAVTLLILGVAIWALSAYPEQAAFFVAYAAVAGGVLWAAAHAQTRFGTELVSAFFSALLPCAVTLVLGWLAVADFAENGWRRDGDLEAPVYWVISGFFLMALIVAIHYARVFWRLLRRSSQHPGTHPS